MEQDSFINQDQNYDFFDESGTDGKSKFLALGLIEVKDIVNFHKVLDGVRDNHRYRNEIKFEKVSNLRAAIAKEWIDEFFGFREVKFHCLVTEKQKAGIPLINLKKWSRFKIYTKQFLDKCLREKKVRFYFDTYNKAQDRQFKEYLLTHVKGLENIQSINSKDYDVLQICDLLLGAVRASFEKTITSAYKKEIIRHIQKKLSIEELDQSIDKDNFSIAIWDRDYEY